MNFLKSGLQTVLGSQEPGTLPSGAETVERLVERVSSSTLLEDRRDACRALKALSKKFRVEVGAQGMPVLLQVMEMDRADAEIIGYCLDTLCHVTSPEQFDEEADNPAITVNIGEQFTEMFIKTSDNVGLVLNCLEEYDFRVRWSSIKLLTSLLANRPKEIQEIVLVSPMGVSKLMDLLIDSREVIRNDALLLLFKLTKGNANIQKIVAFENAFDRLFDVIKEEGCTDGGIIVEDCLLLMLNLLKNNPSNQQFFKEGSYIQRLAPMFVIPPEQEEVGMTPQKVSNLLCMLQIVRSLVSPINSQHVISSCQKAMRSSGLLEGLCNILMGSGISPDILTETISTVAEVIRGDINNQEYFNSVLAPSNPPRPALIVLLMSMVNEKQPLPLRTAVLYCFQSFLYKNEPGQNALIQTLLPTTAQVSSLTSGQLLLGGLFSTDPLSNWFSAVTLSHALLENPTQKEQLLRVLLATLGVNTPVPLLQQCTQLLQQASSKFQSKVALLMLLSIWLSHCQMAVKTFLSLSGSVAYLIAQISANEHDDNEYLIQGLCAFLMGICIQFNDSSVPGSKREDLCQLLIKRIGLETFGTKLGEVSKHESYSRSAKHPQITIHSSSDLLLDYEFCKLFKALESIITKTVNGYGNGTENITELTLSQEASGLVGQYKDIIRDQDSRLQQLQERLKQMEIESTQLKAQLDQAQNTNSQLSDQNILLKAQLQAASDLQKTQQHQSPFHLLSTQGENTSHQQMEALEAQLAAVTLQNQEHQSRAGYYETENQRLRNELEILKQRTNEAETSAQESKTDLENLRKDQEDLMELMTDQENKIRMYRKQLKSLGCKVDDDSDDEDEDIQLQNGLTVDGNIGLQQ
ncbi:general vesicular transport factor p115 [Sabethes cyaneus]|uniref:general vesicular transport factor p115 n=1 Tax=Sabethes cyaneus TaxID=53552 RepID=UPI00221E2EC7|nr:general vesicular transport factor p115 [Sabethes cyaneus]